jgi:filamentous hemagglutinin family protein
MIKHLISLLTTTTLWLLPAIARAQTYKASDRIPVADNSQIGTQVSGANGQFSIDGGLQRGQNLFHSFTDFSIPTNGAANFTNPAGNQSIITRVTGNLFSDINGLVNTNGANFLLINPHGVVFGTNARLNVGKAFMTSTASGVDFVDPTGRAVTFGVNQAGDIPLLTIDPNVAFNPARLIMNANIPGSKGIENYGTLETKNPGQYIGLIGGNVSFYGGQMIAPGAKVELGGLVKSGTVGFNLDNGVQFPKDVDRGNVSLVARGTSPSLIDVRSGGGGSVGIVAKDITVQGTGTRIGSGILAKLGSPSATAGNIKLDATGDVKLADTAAIINSVERESEGKGGEIEIITGNLSVTNAGVSASTLGKGDAGNIKIIATGNISFDESVLQNFVIPGAIGKGGRIEIVTSNLSLTNGSQFNAATLGKGDAGSIKITASGNISFDGIKDGFGTTVYSTVETGAEGKGGGIDISTGNLFVTNGAHLESLTSGKGDAGDIKIRATGNVYFDGRTKRFASEARSTVEPGAVGKAGDIDISSSNLFVTNGALLRTSSKGKGDAGNIKIEATGNVSFDGSKYGLTSGASSELEEGAQGKGGGIDINTQNLFVTNGAVLSANSKGKGDAGNIKIKATGNVSFDGGKNGLDSGAFSAIGEKGVGKGGDIEITSGNLTVTNNARLVANNQADSGNQSSAGNISVKANQIILNNGLISSQSTSSGGNINFATTDYLLLRNDSLIATNSDSTGKNGNGGNITINSPLIVALPGNNDITANAYNGTGGKVKIESQGLFGIKYRPKGQDLLSTNDITASSTFGQNGTVNISTPGTDPGKDSTELPKTTTDASNQISQVCSASNRQNKLTVTGRGGLPPNANDPLTSDAVWQDARAISGQLAVSSGTTNPAKLAPPAVSWVFDGKGKVTLVAAGTQGQPTGTSVVCPSNK